MCNTPPWEGKGSTSSHATPVLTVIRPQTLDYTSCHLQQPSCYGTFLKCSFHLQQLSGYGTFLKCSVINSFSQYPTWSPHLASMGQKTLEETAHNTTLKVKLLCYYSSSLPLPVFSDPPMLGWVPVVPVTVRLEVKRGHYFPIHILFESFSSRQCRLHNLQGLVQNEKVETLV